MGLQHLAKRLPRRQLLHPRELRRLFERTPQGETQQAAEPAQHERHAPPQRRHQLRRQPGANGEADAGGHRHPQRDAREHHRADKRRLPRRGFDDVGQRARELAAETEPLHQPQHHHQHAGRRAPGGERRHQAHAERRARHDEDRDQEDAAAAVAIAEVAEDDAADWAGQVAGREGGERHHQGDERRRIGEDGVGDVFREDAEDDEVVELERAAEAGEQHDSPPCRADARSGSRRVGPSGAPPDCDLIRACSALALAVRRWN